MGKTENIMEYFDWPSYRANCGCLHASPFSRKKDKWPVRDVIPHKISPATFFPSCRRSRLQSQRASSLDILTNLVPRVSSLLSRQTSREKKPLWRGCILANLWLWLKLTLNQLKTHFHEYGELITETLKYCLFFLWNLYSLHLIGN